MDPRGLKYVIVHLACAVVADVSGFPNGRGNNLSHLSACIKTSQPPEIVLNLPQPRTALGDGMLYF